MVAQVSTIVNLFCGFIFRYKEQIQ